MSDKVRGIITSCYLCVPMTLFKNTRPELMKFVKENCVFHVPTRNYKMEEIIRIEKAYISNETITIDGKLTKVMLLPPYWLYDPNIISLLEKQNLPIHFGIGEFKDVRIKGIPFYTTNKSNGNGTYLSNGNDVTMVMQEEPLKLQFTLDEKQKEIYEKILSKMNECGGATIQVQTGGGKTIISNHIVANKKVKTLVVVHMTEIVKQWKRVFEEQFQTYLHKDDTEDDASSDESEEEDEEDEDPVSKKRKRKVVVSKKKVVKKSKKEETCTKNERNGLRIGIYNDKMNIDDYDIIVATVQKISNRPAEIFKDKIGLLIIDESHHIAANEYKKVLSKVNCQTLAVTATADRKDQKTNYIYWTCGPCCYYEEPYCLLPSELHVIFVERKNAMKEMKMMTEYDMQEDIAKDEFCNNLAKDYCISPDHQNEMIIIFTIREKHARLIAELIPGAMTYIGSDKKGHWDKVNTIDGLPYNEITIFDEKKQKQIVKSHNARYVKGLCNFQYPIARVMVTTKAAFGEGMDYPALSTVIHMAPGYSYIQSTGRVTRKDTENEKKVVRIVDIVHCTWKRCIRKYQDRYENYYMKCFKDLKVFKTYLKDETIRANTEQTCIVDFCFP